MKQLFLSKLTTINAKNKQLSGTWHPEIANQIALQLGGSWELIAYWDKDPRLREKLGVLYDCAVIVDVNEPELIVDALRMPFIFSSKTKLLSILKLEKLSSLPVKCKTDLYNIGFDTTIDKSMYQILSRILDRNWNGTD